MSAHTPGRWHHYAAPLVDIHIGPCVGSHEGERIANVLYKGDTEQSNANAALIAAAPDLLAALQQVSLMDTSQLPLQARQAVAAARAAIAKVKS